MSLPPNLLQQVQTFHQRLQTESPLFTIHPTSPFDPYEYVGALNEFVSFFYSSSLPDPDYEETWEAFLATTNKEAFIQEQNENGCRQLLTAFIRIDRFSSGTLAHALTQGYLVKTLARLGAV